MNELLFHFRGMKGHSSNELISKARHCVKYQLSVYEQSRMKSVFARLIKLDHSFPPVQLLRNKHFQGLQHCWQSEGSLVEDRVLIRDIPEPTIKSSYAI
jgi:hypothetical protein